MGSAGEKKGHALGELGLSRQDIFLRRLPRLGSHGGKCDTWICQENLGFGALILILVFCLVGGVELLIYFFCELLAIPIPVLLLLVAANKDKKMK